MRLRGPHLIGQANLNTSVSSASGLVGVFGIIIIPRNPYTFSFAHELELPGTIGRDTPTLAFPPLTPDADLPRFQFINLHSSALLWAAEWRHIDP